MAGGGRCEGQEFKGFHLLTSQSEPSPSPETTRVPMPLQDFLMSPCIVISGIDISRQTLINYAANTLGDVHDDPSHEEGRLYSLLDQASGGIGLLDKKVIHCELLTCAQSLAGSRMIERFYRMIVPLYAR